MKINIVLNNRNKLSHQNFMEKLKGDFIKKGLVAKVDSENVLRFKDCSGGTRGLSLSSGEIKCSCFKYENYLKISVNENNRLRTIYVIAPLIACIALSVNFISYWEYFIITGFVVSVLIYLISFLVMRLRFLLQFSKVLNIR